MIIEGENARLQASGSDAARSSWQLVAGLQSTLGALMQSTVSVSAQPAVDTATVGIATSDAEFRTATEGEFSFVLDLDKTITGKVSGAGEFSANIEGQWSVLCAAYPTAESGTGTVGGYGVGVGGGQVQDPDFTSAFCQPFAELKGTAPTPSSPQR